MQFSLAPFYNVAEEKEVEQTLSDMMMAVLFAGYDTTSTTLSYALYLIAQHPEVEKRCLEEIDSSPNDLIYCKGVIMETLRMYPPATLVPRTLLKPVKLSGGLVVPEGTQVLIPIWLIQQDPKLFPHPEEFRPDRWVRRSSETLGGWVEREDSDISSDVPPAYKQGFLAFSAGARSCPGQKIATQEAVLVLAGLVKNFKFSSLPGYELRPARCGILQQPIDGVPLKIQARD